MEVAQSIESTVNYQIAKILDKAVNNRWPPSRFITKSEKILGDNMWERKIFLAALSMFIGPYCTILQNRYSRSKLPDIYFYEITLNFTKTTGIVPIGSENEILHKYFQIMAELIINDYVLKTSHYPLLVKFTASSEFDSIFLDKLIKAIPDDIKFCNLNKLPKRDDTSAGIQDLIEFKSLQENTIYIISI